MCGSFGDRIQACPICPKTPFSEALFKKKNTSRWSPEYEVRRSREVSLSVTSLGGDGLIVLEDQDS